MARRCAKAAVAAERPRRGIAFTVFSWLLVVVWAAFIFFMSAQQSTGLSSGFFGEVKAFASSVLALFGLGSDWFSVICHFAEYLVFGVLLANAFGCRLSWGKTFLLAVLCASAYGASDEIHQLFVPGRMCDPLDWLTDTIGACAGVLAAISVFRKRG